MQVRQARQSDARGIAEIHVASWQSAYRGIIPDSFLDNLSVESRERVWETALAEGTDQVLVFEQVGRLIGFASFGPSRDDDSDRERVGEIYAIYLDPGEWRKGYGLALVEAAMETLKAQGFSEVTLWVLDKNERGIGFYEAMGFRADGVGKVGRRRDEVESHEVRYRRYLEGR